MTIFRLLPAFLLCNVLCATVARAQYSDDAFEQKQAGALYDERGFYQNKAITVDGKLVVSSSNGNVSYSYPLSSWQRHGHAFSASLNYCGSVSFSTYGEYEVGGVDNPYTKWNRFSQNRPVWLIGVNGFAVQAISQATAFHAAPDVIDDRFTNGSVTAFDDADFVWTMDGYDICNRMQNFAEGDYNEAPSQNGGNPRYVYRDVIRLLRGDGSVLELLNVNDATTSVGTSDQWGVADHLYTGYYVVNEANRPGYARVRFQDSAANIPPYLWDYLPDAPKYRARIVHYYPGDGLEYVFAERGNPFGMQDLRDPQVRFGGAVANPTLFYLTEIRSADARLLQFEYARHGVNWDFSGAYQAQSFYDSTKGRALLTSFGDNQITYSNSGLTMTSFGRTVKVIFDSVQYSGNADPDAAFPFATLGYLTPTAQAVAALPLDSDSPYRSWVAYVSKIIDPEGRETTFDYESYTRTHRNYGFPRAGSAPNHIDATLKNVRLKEIVEPSAQYTIKYHNRSGGIEVLNVDTNDVMTVEQGSSGDYPHAFSNAAREVKKRTLGGTLLNTDTYVFVFEALPGAPATTPKTSIAVSTDAVTGRVDSSVYAFTRHKLPRSITKEPYKYYTAMTPVKRYAKLNGVVQDSSKTETVYDDIAPYLWLPIEQAGHVNGDLKSKRTVSYQTDTVRRYGENDTLMKYHGLEMSLKAARTDLPTTATILVDTVAYLNVPAYDTSLTVVVNDTIVDKLAMYRKYDSLRFQAQDSLALHTPYRFMMYDPRVYTPLEVRIDTVDAGDYRIPPLFGLVREQWTSDASGTYLGGKSNYYCLFGDCDGGPGTVNWYGKLGLRGSLLSDTIFGRGKTRGIVNGLYDYTTPGLVSTATNSFGAVSRQYYTRSHPKAWQAGGQSGTMIANDDIGYSHPLRDGSYFGRLTGQPTATYQEVRTYTSSGALVTDTLYTMTEHTYFGLAAATVGPNGYLSQYDYDDNGRLQTAWLPYDFQSPDSVYLMDITGLEEAGGHGRSEWQTQTHHERYVNDGTCTPVDTTLNIETHYGFGAFMVNRPVNVIPLCTGGFDTLATDEKGGAQIQSFYKELYYETRTPAIGLLTMMLENTPIGEILGLDSATLQVDVSSVMGECVTLTITIPAYETFEKTYVLNCPDAGTIPGGGGSGSRVHLSGDGLREGDPEKSGATLLSGGDTLDALVRLSIPLGTYTDSIENDSDVTFRFETTTIGAEVRFVDGITTDDAARPTLKLWGDFRKTNHLSDYTLRYVHDDETLKSEIWAKVDDSAHSANRGIGGAATLGESRRTMVEHTFGADYRLLKSRTMIGDPEGPTRIDSVLAQYTGFGEVTRAIDQVGDSVMTELDASARPVKTINQDSTVSTIAYYTTDDQLTAFGIDPLVQDFYGFASAKVTTNENGTVFAQYFDARDKLRREIADSGGLDRITTYEYDLQGRLKQVVNPAGDTTQYWYDDFGRVRYKQQPDLGTVSYAYDDLGNVRFVQTQEQEGHDRLTFNQYDDLSRLVVVGEATFTASPGDPPGGGGHGQFKSSHEKLRTRSGDVADGFAEDIQISPDGSRGAASAEGGSSARAHPALSSANNINRDTEKTSNPPRLLATRESTPPRRVAGKVVSVFDSIQGEPEKTSNPPRPAESGDTPPRRGCGKIRRNGTGGSRG